MLNCLKLLLTVTIVVSLTACEPSNPEPEKGAIKASSSIEVINPWLRKMPPGMDNTAAFMTIKNHTGKPLTLEDVSLDWARMGMIHESKIVDGMAKMEHQDQLIIDDSLEFKPGGLHIMVMGIDQPLVDGQDYNIFLHFADREPLAVKFKLGQANQ
ncbi:copper chaperone PCu(A)C [Kangiella sp. TOML190]|uniref:copper chaperone PCu(A)C n=1 Tax=Kangiella sp. TOML190 TaxID=2931351 RepID=UPI00203B9E3D|nr:copper chaperone PCu(A)C [Kangiella sp. TOML190]